MELKKEDFILIRTFEDKLVLALRPDFFEIKEVVIKEDVEGIIEKIIEKEPEPPKPTKEELAEIAKQKKIAEKKAELAELLGE